MTVRDNPTTGKTTGNAESHDLDELFYESVNLSEKLNRYVSECRVMLQEEEFRRERDQCQEVLDQQIPEVSPPKKNKEPLEETPAAPEDSETSTTTDQDITSHEMTIALDDEHVTEEMKMSSSASSLSESDIELSDALTEVSSTDSISGHSDRESIELEIDDYNFKDCSITRRVTRGAAPKTKVKSPPRELSLNEKTKRYMDQVDKMVSCRCCRSVMGRIVHEVRQCESALNYANLKPYQPKTSIITNVKEAVDFQIQYEREWYSAIMIQRAWRAYHEAKLRQMWRFERVRQKNEMRLKYGHIAGFVMRRDAMKKRGYYY